MRLYPLFVTAVLFLPNTLACLAMRADPPAGLRSFKSISVAECNAYWKEHAVETAVCSDTIVEVNGVISCPNNYCVLLIGEGGEYTHYWYTTVVWDEMKKAWIFKYMDEEDTIEDAMKWAGENLKFGCSTFCDFLPNKGGEAKKGARSPRIPH